jgi:serine/threonine-protein kinase
MGIVYRASRGPDAESVALKIMRGELCNDDMFRKRFLHEARAAGQIKHRHLVPILDAGEALGRPYIAVAYVRGETLADRIRNSGPLRISDVVRIAGQVGGALDALHAEGLVHRDVKPSNIMLDESGSAALTDFGLAKGPAYTVLTKPGQVMGTLDYLAPELIRGEPAGSASDIYALGCVIFECVKGSPPFALKGAFQVAMGHLEEEPPDPCEGRDDAPALLSSAVLAALAKDPQGRPSTATAYANALRVATMTRPA